MSVSNNIVRVAHITKEFTLNGITSVVLNYTRKLDKSRFRVTIIAGSPVLDSLRDECIKNDIEIIEIPPKIESSKAYYASIWKILRKGKFDIIHVHGNSATITVELMMAWMLGIKVRIAHCHNSSCGHLKAHNLLLPLFLRLYSKGYACSTMAGRWLFGESPFDVLVNGFDTKSFLFDGTKREILRNELGLTGKFVIGNVAGFNDQKNHEYLLDIFEKVADRDKEAVLFLVGEGEMLDKILELIKVHPYKDRIIYYGPSCHVEDLYNLMDVFVLPSKYEGLGLVFLEAQINGLNCFASDQVPGEVNLNNQTTFLSLNKEPDSWATEILSINCCDRRKMSIDSFDQSAAYDIDICVKTLEHDYLLLLDRL